MGAANAFPGRGPVNERTCHANLTAHPVIPAVRQPGDLERALAAPAPAVMLLFGDILEIGAVVERCRARGKMAFLHFDLLGGLSADRAAVAFLQRHVRPHGIVTTKSQVIRYTLDAGLCPVLRVFAVDSAAVAGAVEVTRRAQPHVVEVLPATVPAWVFRAIREEHGGPVIAGGLLRTVQDVRAALAAGADAVSVARPDLWTAGA